MSLKGRNKSKPTNNKKLGSFYYSWHFWFLHIIVLLMTISIYIASKGQILISVITGLLIYLLPMFVHYIRGVGTTENLKMFYGKSVRPAVKNRK